MKCNKQMKLLYMFHTNAGCVDGETSATRILPTDCLSDLLARSDFRGGNRSHSLLFPYVPYSLVLAGIRAADEN